MMVTQRTDISSQGFIVDIYNDLRLRYLRMCLPVARDHSTDTRSSVEGPPRAFEDIWD